MTTIPPSRQWFTTAAIATMVGLSARTIVREIRLGELRACRVRREYRIARQEAIRYVRQVGGRWLDEVTDTTDTKDTRNLPHGQTRADHAS